MDVTDGPPIFRNTYMGDIVWHAHSFDLCREWESFKGKEAGWVLAPPYL